MDAKELAAEVQKRSGIEKFDKFTAGFVWHKSPTGQFTSFEIGKPLPFPGEPATVIGVFRDETTVRVYAVSVGKETKTPPRCYELDIATPTYSWIDMPGLETFIDALADEWSEFYNDFSTAEAERASILEYLEGLPSDVSLATAIVAIRDEEHLEGDEEEEGPEEAVAVEPSVSTPAAGTTTA